MSADKLSLEIAALEKQSSKAKNAVIKKVLLKKIDKLKVELEAITSAPVAKAKIQRAKTKISQMTPKEFADYIKKLSKDPKYSFLKGMSSDEIARDVKRTAKPVGWRFRGRQNFKTPTKRDVKDNNNVYYENRRNRSDVSRSLRLKEGGEVGSGKNIYEVKEKIYDGLGSRTIADFPTEKEAKLFMFDYQLRYPNAKLNIGVTYFLDSSDYADGGGIKGKFLVETGGGISSIKVGAKLGLLNPRNGRYKYSIIEKIEGENVYLVEKHPTRSQWDNHWETTKSNIKRFLNEDNEDFKSKKSYVLKYADGGGIDGWENLSNVKPNNIEISETSAFGNPDKLILKYNGKQIAKFYYNMRGYNSDFSLKNSEGLYYGFGGDKPKSKQVSEFKKALKEGFTFIKGSKYKNGGGIDINELNMPVIRTQFEDEDYEFEDGGEITANERMQSLKNYPKLKF